MYLQTYGVELCYGVVLSAAVYRRCKEAVKQFRNVSSDGSVTRLVNRVKGKEMKKRKFSWEKVGVQSVSYDLCDGFWKLRTFFQPSSVFCRNNPTEIRAP